MKGFFTSRDRATEDLPKIKQAARAEMREQLVHALEAARIHLTCVSHNPLAVKRQQAIILNASRRSLISTTRSA